MENLTLSRQKMDLGLIVVPSEEGWLQVWERPLTGCAYLVSVRGGGAMKVVGGKRDAERSVIMVLRRGYIEEGTGTKVRTRLAARLTPPIVLDATPLAELVAMVSDWYGGALCMVEVKDGPVLAKECQRLGASVQVREVLDRVSGKFTEEIGWLTDEPTWLVVENCLKNAIRDGTLQMECPHCRAELGTLVPVGSDAPAVSHDDDVRTLATGLYNIESASVLRPHTRARMAPQDGWRVGVIGEALKR